MVGVCGVVLLLWLVCTGVQEVYGRQQGASKYDRLCQDIVKHAQAAAHHHNQGNTKAEQAEHMVCVPAQRRHRVAQGETERQRETERDRERDRERQRETHTHTHTHTHTQNTHMRLALNVAGL